MGKFVEIQGRGLDDLGHAVAPVFRNTERLKKEPYHETARCGDEQNQELGGVDPILPHQSVASHSIPSTASLNIATAADVATPVRAARKKRRRRVRRSGGVLNGHSQHHHAGVRPIPLVGLESGDVLQQVHTIDHPPEDHVPVVHPGAGPKRHVHRVSCFL